MVAIYIHNITKRFSSGKGETIAVDDVTLEVPSGNLFFLLGPSGCGKTTLLRMIAGFTLPTSGQIFFDRQDISLVPPYRRDTGMVFQSYALWPHMTVAENVGFGLIAHKVKNPERNNRIDAALALVQLEHLKDRRPNQLSGGQQQRVALARAIAIRPKCLLLDEPLSNLDAKLRLEMRSEIRRIVKQSGITAICVTHDQKEALSMADLIAVMKNGKLEQVGSPEQLYRQPQTRFVADFIGESNFLRGTIKSIIGSQVILETAAGRITASAPSVAQFTVGQTVTAAFRPEALTISSTFSPSPSSTTAGMNRLIGKRISTAYLGEMAEHQVAVPGIDKPIKAFEMNPQNIVTSSGELVEILVPVEHMIIVRDSGAPSSRAVKLETSSSGIDRRGGVALDSH